MGREKQLPGLGLDARRPWCAGLLLLSGILWCATLTVAWDGEPVAPVEVSPDSAMQQGRQAFQQGHFAQAVGQWRAAVKLYAQHKQADAQSEALIYLAGAYQALGHYQQALTSLQTALTLARQSANRIRLAQALGSLGNVYAALGPVETAELHLRDALDVAQRLHKAALTASILNNLGNVLLSQNKPQEAFEAYTQGARLARKAGQSTLAVQASINAAMAAVKVEHYLTAKTLLDETWQRLRGFEPTHDKAYGLTKIGLIANDLRPSLPQLNDPLLLRAADAFDAAARVAQRIDDARAMSYAWGYLGHLYETEHRYLEALHLTRRAVMAAQRVQAPEALYRWQWQTGRLFRAQGDSDAAIAAYRRAIATLQAIRPELLHHYAKPPTSFRDSTGRLYFELVDLLLRRAAALQDRQQDEPYLREARETVELFKAAELRDYFRDDCVDAALARTVELDRLAQSAVIVYPILLPDRLELLVSLPQGLKRVAVPVEADKLERVVRRFRLALQEGSERRYMRHAQRLYDWLIRPLKADLARLSLSTLVFVPDGALRTIPMAALHDGQAFLVSKYALATTPGLDLTDARPLSRDDIQALTVGISAPVQGFPALPHVSEELGAIQQLYGGTLLLNQAFQLARLEKELRQKDFGIVHIASHGQFTGDVRQSFVLAFDDKLTLDRLAEVVGRLRFRTEPLELLTLSACETALGDDQAALGLAGIAIKAGARSALATLWRVADEAAAVLVTEFYRQLKDPSVSRAVALQRAQLKLLHDPRYHSPFFWSPFLLINNWF